MSEGNRRGEDERWCVVKEELGGPGLGAGCHAANRFTENRGGGTIV